jgi:hypothetical protein
MVLKFLEIYLPPPLKIKSTNTTLPILLCDVLCLYALQVPPSGLVFKYGRVDCPTSPATTAMNNFPSADLNYTGNTTQIKK